MSVFESIIVALVAIRANKMRSVLTMLGVIIGVGSVIAMIAMGRGASADVEERIKSMGTDLLTVWPGEARAGRMFGGVGSRDALKLPDAYAILDKCEDVLAVAPQVSGTAQAKWSNRSGDPQVVGTTASYPTVNNHAVESGRFFSEREARGSAAVCLLGTTTRDNLLGRNDPIGQRVRVKNIPFDVIGVLQSKGDGSGFRDPDDIIVIPIGVAMRRVFGQTYVDRIFVQGKNGRLDEATRQIEKLLRTRHRIRPGKPDDFNVRAQTEILSTFSETSATFTKLLASIAAMSLLVGGIGVMNIMLVSVTERTREIGIRKAVGATRRDILMQFVIESLTLCLVGGLLGTAMGIGAAVVISKLAGWRTMVTGGSILLAFAFSAAVGIGFGIYPAQKAALLHPIEALRYE